MRKNKKILFSVFIFILTVIPGFSDEKTVDIHGFISQGYLKSDFNNLFADTEEGTFQFNEMGISFSAQVTDNLNMGIQFHSMDLGDFGNDEIQLDWGFADYRWRDFFGIRAGKIKVPHGLYNEYQDVDSVTSLILFPIGIYNESWREVTSAAYGIGIYGALYLNYFGKIKYQLLIGSTNLTTDSSMMKVFKDTVTRSFKVSEVDIEKVDVRTSYVYSLFLNNPLAIEGLRAGVSGWMVDFYTEISFPLWESFFTTEFTNKKFTFSLEYTSGSFRIAWEYNIMNFDFDFIDTYKELDYYYLISYQFLDWLEGSVCYSEKYYNKDDREGQYFDYLTGQDFTGWIKDTAISTRFDMNSNWSLKLEGHYFDGVALLIGLDNGPPVDIKDGVPIYPYKQYWYLFAAKVSYSF